MARLQWHPAFVQAMAIELADYQDVLIFESEHQLTAEPLRIDVLIIKKEKNVVIKKNIGQIFRSFNVVEYKSPNDRATIEDYHKTQCYARLYAALNKADIDDMSVTVVATRHPRKLLSFLKRKYAVQQVQSGIYSVTGDTCPTQLVVSEELPVSDNLWLNSLRNDLVAAQLERFAQVPQPNLPMDAYTFAIGEANLITIEEMIMQKKKGYVFSKKIDDYFFAKSRAETTVNILRARFHRVPKETEKAILAMTDAIALDSWAVHAATCSSLDEFIKALK